jgi:electron transport complex protein RnfD
MTNWPVPFESRWTMTDAVSGATPLAIIKEGLDAGKPLTELVAQLPPYFDFFIGTQGGSLGEVSGLALVIGLIYMLYRKIITWHIPFSMLGAIAIFSGIFWLINPDFYMDPLFHILTGGVLLGAIFMATDYVTSPMSYKGMVLYGIGIGLLTVVIRLWGAYPEGVSFAILIMNAFVPMINKYLKPKRFGVK